MPRSPLDPHVATARELEARGGRAFLVYHDIDEDQIIVPLPDDRDRLTIGRSRGNDIVLDWDSEISRVHAALERVGDDWTVVDDGLSRNGTYLNGARVKGRMRLRDSDVLTAGGVAIAYREPARDPASHPTVTALGAAAGERLTPAQRRVLMALCRPFKQSPYATPATNQQIADELTVSAVSVKSTMRALFALFGIEEQPHNQKRASLALQALRTGVVTRRDL